MRTRITPNTDNFYAVGVCDDKGNYLARYYEFIIAITFTRSNFLRIIV